MVIGDWLDPNWAHRAPGRSYVDAPTRDDLQKLTRGGVLYRDNCSACHTGGESVGPPLRGVVARRDPRWLARWIKEPDKMLEEKDPLAVEIFEQYGRVPMPNTGLGDEQVAAIIEHLRRADIAAAGGAPQVAKGEGGGTPGAAAR
jgi:protein SCO1